MQGEIGGNTAHQSQSETTPTLSADTADQKQLPQVPANLKSFASMLQRSQPGMNKVSVPA